MGLTKKNIVLAATAALLGSSAMASEDYDLRYAPGIGARDMSAPFEGGWVFQARRMSTPATCAPPARR